MTPDARQREDGQGAVRRYVGAPAAGFSYLGVLILVAIMTIMLAATGELWSMAVRRDKEAELLFVGGEFRRAIRLYYESTPGTSKQLPKRLEDLIRDPRYPTVRRYLRKLYFDPVTGKQEWGLIEQPDGSIAGVHSLSHLLAIKHNPEMRGVPPGRAERHSDWKFHYSDVAVPPVAGSASGAGGAASAAATASSGSPPPAASAAPVTAGSGPAQAAAPVRR